ncbi:MAG: 23S rRNA (guanosine(2251)-2'-O)-methyltransferase RlmB [Candidatus Margulisiibacteriota bacterium]|jgi:23S rRNA (guanosine2251-2'-O)-methyltransferase
METSIKGKRAIKEALVASTPIERILISDHVARDKNILEIINLAKEKNVKFQVLPRDAFRKKFESGYANHNFAEQNQGIIANLLPTALATLEGILNYPTIYPIVLAVDHLSDPYNFGAILRTAEALNIKAVVYPKDRSCNLTPGVIKVSSGAVYHLNLVRVTNLSQTLDKFKDHGYWLYGADSNGGVDLNKMKPNFPLVLVVGNEEKGISYQIQKKLDQKINIPLKGHIESLNVSVATSIILYQLSLMI